jgi:hypothetical protein
VELLRHLQSLPADELAADRPGRHRQPVAAAPAGIQAVEIGAVAGQEFDVAFVQRVTDGSPPASTPTAGSAPTCGPNAPGASSPRSAPSGAHLSGGGEPGGLPRRAGSIDVLPPLSGGHGTAIPDPIAFRGAD